MIDQTKQSNTMVTYNNLENTSNSLYYSDILQYVEYVPIISGNYLAWWKKEGKKKSYNHSIP